MTRLLFSDTSIPRSPQEIYPGVVYYPGWLSMKQQRYLVSKFFEWGRGEKKLSQPTGRVGIPPHHPTIFGKKMSVKLTSLGWHWSHYEYTRTAPEFGDASPLPVPEWIVRLGRSALADAYAPKHAPSWPLLGEQLQPWANSYTPDIALINYYEPSAHMGMHQDKEEISSMPVVSLSIGDTAVFRAGNTLTKSAPYRDIQLVSGDLLVFGGPSRFMYHGIPKILAGTAPEECGLHKGRINITLRQTGLTG